MRDRILLLARSAEPWFYRVALMLVFSVADDPALLALAFC